MEFLAFLYPISPPMESGFDEQGAARYALHEQRLCNSVISGCQSFARFAGGGKQVIISPGVSPIFLDPGGTFKWVMIICAFRGVSTQAALWGTAWWRKTKIYGPIVA